MGHVHCKEGRKNFILYIRYQPHVYWGWYWTLFDLSSLSPSLLVFTLAYFVSTYQPIFQFRPLLCIRPCVGPVHVGLCVLVAFTDVCAHLRAAACAGAWVHLLACASTYCELCTYEHVRACVYVGGCSYALLRALVSVGLHVNLLVCSREHA